MALGGGRTVLLFRPALVTCDTHQSPPPTQPLLHRTLRGETETYIQRQLYIPPSLDAGSQRRLSLNLGNGNCKWEPPAVDVPSNIDFHKTVIAGFPSGDKRMIFIQMESLTGWRK